MVETHKPSNKKLETALLFKNRKVEFITKKNTLKTSLFDNEIKDLAYFDMPYKGIFNKGAINIFLVNVNEFKEYESKTINNFLNNVKVTGGVSYKTSIFVTGESNPIIQHELQHVFDYIINLKTPIWEHEYRAYLASLIYGKDSENVLIKLAEYVVNPLKEVGYDFFKKHLEHIIKTDKEIETVEPHELAILKIIVDLDKNVQGELNEQNIIEISEKLMNENYIKNFGATPAEIIEEMQNLLERY